MTIIAFLTSITVAMSILIIVLFRNSQRPRTVIAVPPPHEQRAHLDRREAEIERRLALVREHVEERNRVFEELQRIGGIRDGE